MTQISGPQRLTRPHSPRSVFNDLVEGAQDLKESLSLLLAGSLFLHQKDQAQKLELHSQPLADVPNVDLKKPLVICPGWNTELHKFDFLTQKLLASGHNGERVVYLKEGHSYRDPECSLPLEQIPSNTRLFVNIWDSCKAGPDSTVPQLRQNMTLLHEAIGPDKVDLLGYSMGGLTSRKYLDDGGSDIHNFMMLGTPNNGTRFGQMSARVIERDVDWAMKFSGLTEEDGKAMSWLAAGAPKLEQLNSRWPEQQSRVNQALVVGGRTLATPAMGWLPFRPGDSMVEESRLSIPGMPAKVLEGSGFLNHITLPHDSQVFAEMQRFFDFQPVSPPETTSAAVTQPVPHDNSTPYGQL